MRALDRGVITFRKYEWQKSQKSAFWILFLYICSYIRNQGKYFLRIDRTMKMHTNFMYS